MRSFFLSLFVISNIICEAQTVSSSFATKFEQIVQRMVTENYRPFNLIREMNAESLPDSLIPLLNRYATTPHSVVQNCIYESYFEYGMTSKDLAFKKQMINYLLDACACIDSIELSYSCHESTNFLMQFENNLFDKNTIKIINERAKKNNKSSLDYAYLSGKLYQKQMISIFEKQLCDAKYDEVKYKLNIILSRLGYKKSISIVRDSLLKMNIEDRLWTNKKSFIYIRQKEIVDILFRDLESNETETPYYEQWMDIPLEGYPYSKRALDILTQMIKDFPIRQKSDLDYTDEDLYIALKWAKQHHNYEIRKEGY
jgi:hypothetical protein